MPCVPSARAAARVESSGSPSAWTEAATSMHASVSTAMRKAEVMAAGTETPGGGGSLEAEQVGRVLLFGRRRRFRPIGARLGRLLARLTHIARAARATPPRPPSAALRALPVIPVFICLCSCWLQRSRRLHCFHLGC